MDAPNCSENPQCEIVASEFSYPEGVHADQRSETPMSQTVSPPEVDEASCYGWDTPLSGGDFPNTNHVPGGSSVDIPTPDTASIATDHLDLDDHDVSTPTPSMTDRQAEDTDTDSDNDENSLSYELQKGSRILREIMREANKSITWPFKNAVDPEAPGCSEYYQVVEKPIWLRKMREKFDNRVYETITEFVADFRRMLENCYRFNGPDHAISKKAQKLETILEQKLALLSRELRDKTSISATTGAPSAERQFSGTRKRKTVVPHDSTALLNQLRLEEKEREKEWRKQQMEEKRKAQEDFIAGLQAWEDGLLAGSLGQQLKAMWELPQIGHFFFLCQVPLNIGEVTQYELERCFLMPRESTTMQRIMTTLVSTPYQRTRLEKKPFMPYKVWEDKVRVRLRQWYKVYKDSGKDAKKTAMKLGLEENFFKVVGFKNPMEKKKFHELTYYQRVWIVKGLCDYSMEHNESLREALETQPVPEQREYPLGTDAEGNQYLHFPQFCGADLRIYRQAPIRMPKMEKKETIQNKDEYLELVRGSRQKKGKTPQHRKKTKRRPPPSPVPQRKRVTTPTPTKEDTSPSEPRPRDTRLRQNPRQVNPYQLPLESEDTCEESSLTASQDDTDAKTNSDSENDTSKQGSESDAPSTKVLKMEQTRPGRTRTPRKRVLDNEGASSRESTPSTVVRRSLRKIIEESKLLIKNEQPRNDTPTKGVKGAGGRNQSWSRSSSPSVDRGEEESREASPAPSGDGSESEMSTKQSTSQKPKRKKRLGKGRQRKRGKASAKSGGKGSQQEQTMEEDASEQTEDVSTGGKNENGLLGNISKMDVDSEADEHRLIESINNGSSVVEVPLSSYASDAAAEVSNAIVKDATSESTSMDVDSGVIVKDSDSACGLPDHAGNDSDTQTPMEECAHNICQNVNTSSPQPLGNHDTQQTSPDRTMPTQNQSDSTPAVPDSTPAQETISEVHTETQIECAESGVDRDVSTAVSPNSPCGSPGASEDTLNEMDRGDSCMNNTPAEVECPPNGEGTEKQIPTPGTETQQELASQKKLLNHVTGEGDGPGCEAENSKVAADIKDEVKTECDKVVDYGRVNGEDTVIDAPGQLHMVMASGDGGSYHVKTDVSVKAEPEEVNANDAQDCDHKDTQSADTNVVKCEKDTVSEEDTKRPIVGDQNRLAEHKSDDKGGKVLKSEIDQDVKQSCKEECSERKPNDRMETDGLKAEENFKGDGLGECQDESEKDVRDEKQSVVEDKDSSIEEKQDVKENKEGEEEGKQDVKDEENAGVTEKCGEDVTEAKDGESVKAEDETPGDSVTGEEAKQAAQESSDDDWEEVEPEIGPFELVADSVERLRLLKDRFMDPEELNPPTPGSKRPRTGGKVRKRCEKELHEQLMFLLKELEPWEQKLVAANRKARIKMRKEQENYQEEEDEVKEVRDVWDSEESVSNSSDDSDSESGSEDTETDNKQADKIPKKKVNSEGDATPSKDKDQMEELGISTRGRLRKRRIIPNNIEDQGIKKRRGAATPDAKDVKEASTASSVASESKPALSVTPNILQKSRLTAPGQWTMPKSLTLEELAQGQQAGLYSIGMVGGQPVLIRGLNPQPQHSGSKNSALLAQLTAAAAKQSSPAGRPAAPSGTAASMQSTIRALLAAGKPLRLPSPAYSSQASRPQLASTSSTASTAARALVMTSPTSTATATPSKTPPKLSPKASTTAPGSSVLTYSVNSLSQLPPAVMQQILRQQQGAKEAQLRTKPVPQLQPAASGSGQQPSATTTPQVSIAASVSSIKASSSDATTTQAACVKPAAQLAPVSVVTSQAQPEARRMGELPRLQLLPSPPRPKYATNVTVKELLQKVQDKQQQRAAPMETDAPQGTLQLQQAQIQQLLLQRQLAQLQVKQRKELQQMVDAGMLESEEGRKLRLEHLAQVRHLQEQLEAKPQGKGTIMLRPDEDEESHAVHQPQSTQAPQPTPPTPALQPSQAAAKPQPQPAASHVKQLPSAAATLVFPQQAQQPQSAAKPSPQQMPHTSVLEAQQPGIGQAAAVNQIPANEGGSEVSLSPAKQPAAVAAAKTAVNRPQVISIPRSLLQAGVNPADLLQSMDQSAIRILKQAPPTATMATRQPVSSVQQVVTSPISQMQAPVHSGPVPEPSSATSMPASKISSEDIKQALAKKKAIDNAIKAVITTVHTTLPTAQIKVVGPSPLQMPSRQPHRPVTLTTTAMKGPIPVVPQLKSETKNKDLTRTVSSPSPSSQNQNMVVTTADGGTPSLKTAAPQNKTLALKVSPQNLMTPQGMMQGIVLPPGVMLPANVLQQLTASKAAGGQGLIVVQQDKDGSLRQVTVAANTQGTNVSTVVNTQPATHLTPATQPTMATQHAAAAKPAHTQLATAAQPAAANVHLASQASGTTLKPATAVQPKVTPTKPSSINVQQNIQAIQLATQQAITQPKPATALQLATQLVLPQTKPATAEQLATQQAITQPKPATTVQLATQLALPQTKPATAVQLATQQAITPTKPATTINCVREIPTSVTQTVYVKAKESQTPAAAVLSSCASSSVKPAMGHVIPQTVQHTAAPPAPKPAVGPVSTPQVIQKRLMVQNAAGIQSLLAANPAQGQPPKLMLFNVNGQLVTAQGVPVCLSQGAVITRPQPITTTTAATQVTAEETAAIPPNIPLSAAPATHNAASAAAPQTLNVLQPVQTSTLPQQQLQQQQTVVAGAGVQGLQKVAASVQQVSVLQAAQPSTAQPQAIIGGTLLQPVNLQALGGMLLQPVVAMQQGQTIMQQQLQPQPQQLQVQVKQQPMQIQLQPQQQLQAQQLLQVVQSNAGASMGVVQPTVLQHQPAASAVLQTAATVHLPISRQ